MSGAFDIEKGRNVVTPFAAKDDEAFDRAVRPRRLSEYIGQPRVKAQLEIFITAARQRREALDHVLFGFFTEAERALFRSLLKISNVGPRIALGVLSGMSVDGFYQCVRDKDLVSLTKVPGVGRKTAERLLIEMSDRLPESLGADAATLPARSAAEGEAHGALLALGYKPGEVVRMLKDLDGGRLSTEEMIREALKRVHRERAADR